MQGAPLQDPAMRVRPGPNGREQTLTGCAARGSGSSPSDSAEGSLVPQQEARRRADDAAQCSAQRKPESDRSKSGGGSPGPSQVWLTRRGAPSSDTGGRRLESRAWESMAGDNRDKRWGARRGWPRTGWRVVEREH